MCFLSISYIGQNFQVAKVRLSVLWIFPKSTSVKNEDTYSQNGGEGGRRGRERGGGGGR